MVQVSKSLSCPFCCTRVLRGSRQLARCCLTNRFTIFIGRTGRHEPDKFTLLFLELLPACNSLRLWAQSTLTLLLRQRQRHDSDNDNDNDNDTTTITKRQRQRQRQRQRDSNCNTCASRTWEAWWCLPARLARAATTTAVQLQQNRKCSCSRTWEARPLLFAIYYLCRSVGSPGGRLGVGGGGCLVQVHGNGMMKGGLLSA